MRLLLAVLVLAPCLRAAGEVPGLEFAPPGTRALIGIHLRTLIDSPLIRNLIGEIAPGGASKISFSSPFPGVNPLKDIDEVVIATTLEGAKPPSLVVCRGRFPADEIARGASPYHGVPLRLMPNAGGLAWIDSKTILAGDLKEIRAAIDRRKAPAGAAVDPALAERAERLRGQYAVWGAGAVPRSYHLPVGSPDGLGSLDQFDFGVGLSQGLQIFAALHVRDVADAGKLGSFLELMKGLAKPNSDPNGTRLETSVENGTLTFSLLVPEQVLHKALIEQRANFGKLLAQAATGAAGAAVPMSFGAFGVAPSAPAPPKPPAIVTDEQGNTLVVTLPGKR